MLAPNPVYTELERARNLIADKTRWGQGLLCDTRGRVCAIGALGIRLDTPVYDEQTQKACQLLGAAANELFGRGVVYVNDGLGHAAVLRMYERALFLASTSPPSTEGE